MVFLAKITLYDLAEQTEEVDRVALIAANFFDAMEQIEDTYGRDLINVYLEPISDSNLIYLDEDTAKAIRDNPYNEF